MVLLCHSNYQCSWLHEHAPLLDTLLAGTAFDAYIRQVSPYRIGAALFLAAALSAQAGDLAIVSGGRRIIGPNRASLSANCAGWSYTPMPIIGDSGKVV